MNQDTEYYQARDAAKFMESTSSEVAKLGQVITPEIPADGKGYRSLYSFRNMVEMRLGDHLARMGVSWKRVGKYISDLRVSNKRWLDSDGLDGWLVLDSSWNWGAGTTLDIAVYSVFKGRHTDVFIAVDVGMIKDAIRSAIDNNGDAITDDQLKEVIEQVENEGNKIRGGR